MESYDLIVVGGGSAGAAAAISAGRLGLKTLLVEKEGRLGGTGVHAFVNVWQPAYTTSRLAPEVFELLRSQGRAAFVAQCEDTPCGRPIFRLANGGNYQETLKRWQSWEPRRHPFLIVYVPHAMAQVLQDLALATRRVDLWTDATFVDCRTLSAAGGPRRIESIDVHTPHGRRTARADWYIDASADIHLAIRAGCAWTMGREPHSAYDEPSAPPAAEFKLNAWTLCFLIEQGPNRVHGEAGSGPDSDWAHIGQMPNGRYYVNLVYQLDGEAGWTMGPERAREQLLGNIFRRWPLVQRAYGLEEYGIAAIAPRIGMREGPRLIGRYVLTEHDVRSGGFGEHHNDCVAFCDHALDRHAPDGGCIEAENGPFGVPFRCLQTREIGNLLVACRGASFSSLAASACRLQRTMMELGEAATHYVATGAAPKPKRPPYDGWKEGSAPASE